MEQAGLIEDFRRFFTGTPRVFTAPGRVNLIERTVPVGAGLSSSAALEFASGLALLSTVDGHLTPPDLARKIPGCLGARMTGGGFGGCTVNLVSSDAVSSFQSTIRDSYRRETDRNPEIYISPPPAGRGNYDSRKNRERGGG